jgi:hypothetical protein
MKILALCHAQIYAFSPQAAGNLPKEIKKPAYAGRFFPSNKPWKT